MLHALFFPIFKMVYVANLKISLIRFLCILNLLLFTLRIRFTKRCFRYLYSNNYFGNLNSLLFCLNYFQTAMYRNHLKALISSLTLGMSRLWWVRLCHICFELFIAFLIPTLECFKWFKSWILSVLLKLGSVNSMYLSINILWCANWGFLFFKALYNFSAN